MSIDTITISKEKCSRLFAYSPYVPITRVNSDYHEISRGGGGGTLSQLKIITSTQSQVAVDNHLVQHSLSAVLRSHSSTSSSFGNVPLILAVIVRGAEREERKEIRARSR